MRWINKKGSFWRMFWYIKHKHIGFDLLHKCCKKGPFMAGVRDNDGVFDIIKQRL